jgi:hypothetical protein
MTFNATSTIVLVLALAGMYLGWRASVYIGRLLVMAFRLGIAAAFGVLAVYLLWVAWPYLVELQHQGQIHFPTEIANWQVMVRH